MIESMHLRQSICFWVLTQNPVFILLYITHLFITEKYRFTLNIFSLIILNLTSECILKGIEYLLTKIYVI